jgi:hypothetical protein
MTGDLAATADPTQLFVASGEERPALPVDLLATLPAGRLVQPMMDSESTDPVLWMTEGPVTVELWQRWYDERVRTGLWPLLLTGDVDPGSTELRPWQSGEFFPDDLAKADAVTPAAQLAEWWSSHTHLDDETLTDGERTRHAAIYEPYGDQWPGLAPAGEWLGTPDDHAAGMAAALISHQPAHRLGLIAANRGADALAVVGWAGPLNYGRIAPFAVVLRSWERRFGARVIGASFGSLYVSVAAPPTSEDQALHVAAEHFAFCPDNIWQNTRPATLRAYAHQLVGDHAWSFWWD